MKVDTLPKATFVLCSCLKIASGFQSHITQASTRNRSLPDLQNSKRTVLQASDDNADSNNTNPETSEFQSKYIIELDPSAEPLFDPGERATLFGLEPKGEVDPLDNGLAITGPIIMLGSLYVMWALIFDVPIDF